MELLFGTNVREHGHRAGRLAGFEVDPISRCVLKIIFSGDGELGGHALARPFSSVALERGEIHIQPHTASSEHAPGEPTLLSHSARIVRSGRLIGRLAGVEVTPVTGQLAAVLGRQHWWTRRFRVEASSCDLSVPGEVRTGVPGSQAA